MKVIILTTHHPTKVIMLKLEKNLPIEITMQTIRHKIRVIPATEKGWRLNKRMKSTVHVKSIPGATTKGMKHHVR